MITRDGCEKPRDRGGRSRKKRCLIKIKQANTSFENNTKYLYFKIPAAASFHCEN